MAERIQRKRTKGWRMPEGAVYVGRPSKFGNPFKEEGDWVYVHVPHRRIIFDPWVVYGDKSEIGAVELFRALMLDPHSYYVEKAVRERIELMRDTIIDLRGKDLCCWCPLDQPCHADILLELANEVES